VYSRRPLAARSARNCVIGAIHVGIQHDPVVSVYEPVINVMLATAAQVPALISSTGDQFKTLAKLAIFDYRYS
jgi:hypothetical protein